MFSSSSPFSKRATPHNICADICMLENLFEKLLEEKANLTHYPSFICGANCIIQVQVPHFKPASNMLHNSIYINDVSTLAISSCIPSLKQ
jgi:hypothetical protein